MDIVGDHWKLLIATDSAIMIIIHVVIVSFLAQFGGFGSTYLNYFTYISFPIQNFATNSEQIIAVLCT